MIFLKPFNKCHSQYFLIIYKKTATAKLYILTNYFLSIYNATIQRETERKRGSFLQWPYSDALTCVLKHFKYMLMLPVFERTTLLVL